MKLNKNEKHKKKIYTQYIYIYLVTYFERWPLKNIARPYLELVLSAHLEREQG